MNFVEAVNVANTGARVARAQPDWAEKLMLAMFGGLYLAEKVAPIGTNMPMVVPGAGAVRLSPYNPTPEDVSAQDWAQVTGV